MESTGGSRPGLCVRCAKSAHLWFDPHTRGPIRTLQSLGATPPLRRFTQRFATAATPRLVTIRKRSQVLDFTGVTPRFRIGRLRSEEKDPQLAADIRAFVDPHTYADPELKSSRRYTNLSAAEVRQALIDKGHSEKGVA